MAVGEVKTKNVARAVQLIKEAAGGGAQLVVLPECFNSPYGTSKELHLLSYDKL